MAGKADGTSAACPSTSTQRGAPWTAGESAPNKLSSAVLTSLKNDACFPQSRSALTEDGWQAGQISVASPGQSPQVETP